MTNNIKAIDFNGVKVILDTNTKLKHLTVPSGATVQSFVDDEDGSDYQVPAGKKATIIYLQSLNGGWGTADAIIYADDQDGITNAVNLIVPAGNISNTIFISAEVPATKWINKNADSADTGDIWIIEESA